MIPPDANSNQVRVRRDASAILFLEFIVIGRGELPSGTAVAGRNAGTAGAVPAFIGRSIVRIARLQVATFQIVAAKERADHRSAGEVGDGPGRPWLARGGTECCPEIQ